MTRNPITIDPDAPLASAMAVMKKKRVRHLPVVDDSGRLVGIITDRDLRSAALARALFYGRPGSLPVLQNAKLVGILTERDVLEVLATRAPEQSAAIEGFPW